MVKVVFELLASGRILGIRNIFFYEQLDLKYDRNVDVVFAEQWNKEWVIQLLEKTIKTGNGTHGYDIMLIMLPNVESHGHHTASGLLALETIERLRQTNIKIPTVIGGSEFVLNQSPVYSSNRLADISSTIPNEFHFNRTWKLSNINGSPDYRMIVIWACSEHKSQGGLIGETMTTYARENEQYFYFSINNEENNETRMHLIQNLFDQLVDIHQYNTGNVL
jgi:hypothetical protein